MGGCSPAQLGQHCLGFFSLKKPGQDALWWTSVSKIFISVWFSGETGAARSQRLFLSDRLTLWRLHPKCSQERPPLDKDQKLRSALTVSEKDPTQNQAVPSLIKEGAGSDFRILLNQPGIFTCIAILEYIVCCDLDILGKSGRLPRSVMAG